MTATVTHNQSMSGVILNGARSGFFRKLETSWFSQPLHHEYNSRPTDLNITAYLDRIHVLNIYLAR